MNTVLADLEAAETSTVAANWRPNVLRLGWLRGRLELLQFFRSRESVVFTLAFPVLMLAIFGAILDYDVTDGVSFTQYFAPSMIAVGIFGASFQSLAIQIPIERDKGVHKRLAGTPLPAAAYVLGKIIMVSAVSLLATALLLAVAVFGYDVALPATVSSWVTFVWVGLLGTAACTVCGIAFSRVPRSGRAAPAIVTPVALVLQVISGVFIPLSELPTWMRQLAALSPLKWLCQGMRAAFLPESAARIELAGSWQLSLVALVLTLWVIAGFFLARSAFRWGSR